MSASIGKVNKPPSAEGFLRNLDERLCNLERITSMTSGLLTANAGLVKPKEESSVAVPHGLGGTPTIVLGGLQDGFFSAEFSWRWSADGTNVSIVFHNLGEHEDTGFLRFIAKL